METETVKTEKYLTVWEIQLKLWKVSDSLGSLTETVSNIWQSGKFNWNF